LRIIEDALALIQPSPNRSRGDGDEDNRSVSSDGFCEPPAPLPPRVSAALSTLALALAPYASPHPSRIAPGVPRSGYSENDDSSSDNVFAMRKIRWADATKLSIESSAGSDDVVLYDSVFSLPKGSHSLNSSTSSAGAAPVAQSDVPLPKISPKLRRPRPTNARQSSDGSVALAHRRQVSRRSANAPSGKAGITGEDEDAWETLVDDVKRDEFVTLEPRTIPGKIVHDLICLIAILVDFLECSVVIIYRVILDMRYGERPSML
jgi:hypothetical protein